MGRSPTPDCATPPLPESGSQQSRNQGRSSSSRPTAPRRSGTRAGHPADQTPALSKSSQLHTGEISGLAATEQAIQRRTQELAEVGRRLEDAREQEEKF